MLKMASLQLSDASPTEVRRKSATMDNKLYNATAGAQLTAHDITREALEKCVKEILKSPGTLRMCDLGSAGGSNALKLLGWVLPLVGDRNVEYFFEDLPNADFSELASTIHKAHLPPNISTSMIGKSFYERLFPPNSIHLSLSYITLHWLSTVPGKLLRAFYIYVMPTMLL